MGPSILAALALVFLGLLYYVYDGYLRLLQLLGKVTPDRNARPPTNDEAPPELAVLITVHNEAHQIVERVQNVLRQGYPLERLDVVVASDGSTDDLATLVTEHFGEAVRVVHSDDRVGKSRMQNQAIETIRAPFVLFSDADTRFTPGFLSELVKPFADPSVGAVQANLLFIAPDTASFSAGQSRYWRSELAIRRAEAHMGILAVASGACIAVRRDLWRPLDPGYGEDCIVPLDVVLQSRRVAYAEHAIAHEPADDALEPVIRNRARMTLRNWQGTCSRPSLLNPLRHPGYALALWSHKLLRWLSPLWILGLSVCAFALPVLSMQMPYLLLATVMLAFYLLALVGGIAAHRSRTVPVGTTAYTFALANIGFLGGLALAARGRTVSQYG